MSWLFVDPKFHKEDGEKVKNMLSLIQKAFGDLVYRANWMDSLTKLATERKIMKMKPMIGYPEWLFQAGVLDEYYKNAS